jgi:hypothetical protein
MLYTEDVVAGPQIEGKPVSIVNYDGKKINRVFILWDF